MKKAIILIFALMVIINITSCDKIMDVDFETSLNQSIPVHLDATSELGDSFVENGIISLDNADTHDYLNLIKDLEIKSLSYKLSNFSGNEDGLIDVQFFVNSTQLLNQTQLQVKTEVDGATMFEVTNTQELNAIAAALLSGNQVNSSFQGTAYSPNGAMDFDVAITINVKATASPL